jgi:hypothetical protein
MPKKPQSVKIDNILGELRKQEINTWFDLGLFIDRLKEQPSKAAFKGNAKAFDSRLEKGGIAFITFYFTIDGITVETEKYAKTFKSIYPNIPIHYIAGEIRPEADELIHEDAFRKRSKKWMVSITGHYTMISSESKWKGVARSIMLLF